MFKKFLNHKFVFSLSVASCLLSLSGFLWAYFSLRKIGAAGPLILHFNDIQGITQVGGLSTILFMGILGIIITAMNGIIALAFDERDALLGKMMAGLTLALALLLFLAFASIISVN